MQRLTCHSCGGDLRAGDFDQRKAILRCRHCATLIDLEKAPAKPKAHIPDPSEKVVTTKARAVAALPEGWTVEKSKNRLQIGFKASESGDSLGKAIVFLRWCAVFCVVLALFHLLVEQDNHSALVIGAPAPICLALMLLLRWHGRSMYLETDRRHLWLEKWMTIKPLMHVPIADIIQLYVAKQVRHSNESRFGPYSPRKTVVDYQLCASLKTESGRRALVIATFDSPRQALFLEQTFEEYLGIFDRRVSGEIKAPSFAI